MEFRTATLTATEVREGDVLAIEGRVLSVSTYAGKTTIVGEHGTAVLRRGTTCLATDLAPRRTSLS